VEAPSRANISLSKLVVQLQSELNLSRIVGGIASGSNLAKVRAGEIGCTGDGDNAVAAKPRSIEVRVVEYIEELSPELQHKSFGELEIFERREIKSFEGWPGDLVWWTT